MENIEKIKILMDKLSIDFKKLDEKNNFSSGVRARKYLQEIRKIAPILRNEILQKIKSIKKERKNVRKNS